MLLNSAALLGRQPMDADGSVRQPADFGLSRLELAPEWRHQHGLDQARDGLSIGVVRTQLSPPAGVESALEERAEDGGLNLRPIEPGACTQDVDLGGQERHNIAA